MTGGEDQEEDSLSAEDVDQAVREAKFQQQV